MADLVERVTKRYYNNRLTLIVGDYRVGQSYLGQL